MGKLHDRCVWTAGMSRYHDHHVAADHDDHTPDHNDRAANYDDYDDASTDHYNHHAADYDDDRAADYDDASTDHYNHHAADYDDDAPDHNDRAANYDDHTPDHDCAAGNHNNYFDDNHNRSDVLKWWSYMRRSRHRWFICQN
jgi:hypothetical protein